MTIRQALFIAPCSHTFHYKCIRPLLESHHPAFSCPLCRTFADLEEDVEVEIEYEEEADVEEIEVGLGDKDGRDDIDVDGESPPGSDPGHGGQHAGNTTTAYLPVDISMDDNFPTSRSNSGLGVRGGGEAGAETEVEGEGSGPGLIGRMRAARRGGASRVTGGTSTNGNGDRASPLADLTDEQDEAMIVDVSHSAGEMGVVSDVDADGMVDLDGTVGGKRKR